MRKATFIVLNLVINAFENWQHCFIFLSTTCAAVQATSHFKESCKAWFSSLFYKYCLRMH